MTASCPSCGAAAAAGRFCSHCGADLEAPASCSKCGEPLLQGARFCNQCGAPAGGPAASDPPRAGATAARLPWIVAGVAVGVLAAVLIGFALERPDRDVANPPLAGPAGDPASVDLSSMSPRERADRLFNRVMTSASIGDTAQARAFLPMALAAYDQVPGLDLDGHYHAAVLLLLGGDPAAARARADSILRDAPNHLFGLFTAAEAERALGNAETAHELYQRFLTHYDEELATGRPEYADHRDVLPVNRAEAVRMVNAAP